MNICESIITGAKLFPEKEALVYEEQRLTYAELERWSSQAASILQSGGVGRGDRVGIVMPNVPAFAVWYYAVLRLGAIAVSVSTRLAPSEIAFMFSDCEALAVIAGEEHVESVREELPDSVRHLLTVSESAEHCQGESLADHSCLESPGWVNTEPHEPAVILYTSGTTGFPKGATLSHQNVRATVHAFNHLCEMGVDDRILISVPLFHCYGQNALLNSGLNVGATLILQRGFDLNASKRLIAEEAVTRLFGVPTTFQLLGECCEPADLRSVGYCFSAAATLPIQLSEHWHDKFGMPIHEGYGLTETAPFASYNHRLNYVPGSIGTPVDLVEMKVIDPDTGETCPSGELGEIVIRGPNVMLGYWNRPQETAAAIRDHWFYSGDIGRMDERGYFYIVDRVKDMIAIGGMKVFPAEVERVLLDHPAIDEAAVVGFPDEVFGEQVVAFVVPGRSHFDVREVRLHCQNNLAAFKSPKHFAVLEELPRNPTGKVLKTRLREHDLQAVVGEWAAGKTAATVVVRAGRAAASDQTEPKTSSPARTPPLVERMQDVHPGGRPRAITEFIQEQLREMIGTDELPDPEARLVETGMDSLMIVDLRDRLQTEVGNRLELPATIVFDYPRICDLASFLAESLDFDAPRSDPLARDATVESGGDALEPSWSETEASLVDTDTVGSDASGHEEATDDIHSMSEEQALLELRRELEG